MVAPQDEFRFKKSSKSLENFLKFALTLIYRVVPVKEDTFLFSILLSPITMVTDNGPTTHTLFCRWAMSYNRLQVLNFQAMFAFVLFKSRRS
jgi:hypothetical protein